jgi:Cys-tRNA(Pro)/Cys-tRNA(Cys) deacylase
MIKQKELLPLTGYVHGGCSPIGMKKQFPTFLHETAILYDTVCVSAGKVGYQIELKPDDLVSASGCRLEDLV